MDQKPVTIKEIARRLNVSVSTVSRALHNQSSIGLSTRMQVQKLAKELNYEPNQAAISFKQGKTLTIGVVLPNLREEFFSMAINGIEDVALKNDYTVLIGQSHDELEREKQIIDTMRKHRVDGIVVSLAKTTKSYEHFEQLERYNIPVVFFDRVPNYKEAWTVSCNLENSSMELVDWLVHNGHKKIAFIKGPEALLHSKQRFEGYLQGLKKNNINPDNSFVVSTDLSKNKTEEAVQKLLLLKNRPTAIIAFNDYVALDAIKFAKQNGVKINKDISFVSYANLPVTSYMDDPPVASVEQFPYQQAEKATEVLFRLINMETDIEPINRKITMESKVVINPFAK